MKQYPTGEYSFPVQAGQRYVIAFAKIATPSTIQVAYSDHIYSNNIFNFKLADGTETVDTTNDYGGWEIVAPTDVINMVCSDNVYFSLRPIAN